MRRLPGTGAVLMSGCPHVAVLMLLPLAHLSSTYYMGSMANSDSNDADTQSKRTKRDFRFKDTRLCFAFPGTMGDRRRAEPYERLNEPEDLARWCVEAGLLVDPPVVTLEQLEGGKLLREAIQRVGEALVAEKRPLKADIELINRFASRPSVAPVLAIDASKATWAGGNLEAVLSLIARDAVATYATAPRDRLRVCESPSCGGLFVDESRPGTRRWCSMSTCGDNAKKVRFRGKPGRMA